MPIHIAQCRHLTQMHTRAGSMWILVYKLVMLFCPCDHRCRTRHPALCTHLSLPLNLQAGWPSPTLHAGTKVVALGLDIAFPKGHVWNHSSKFRNRNSPWHEDDALLLSQPWSQSDTKVVTWISVSSSCSAANQIRGDSVTIHYQQLCD